MSNHPESDDPFDAIVNAGNENDDWAQLDEVSAQLGSVEAANTDWISAITDCYDGANTGTLDLARKGTLRVATIALFKNVRSTAAFLDSTQPDSAVQELGGLLAVCDKQQVVAFGELLGEPLSTAALPPKMHEDKIYDTLSISDRRIEKVATSCFYRVSRWNLRTLLNQAIGN